MLEPKAPPARNGPNTGSLATGVRRRVNKKSTLTIEIVGNLELAHSIKKLDKTFNTRY